MREAGCSGAVIRHSIAVTEKALEIAQRVHISLDMDVLRKGALHHDIGRAKTQELDHVTVGADLAGVMGFGDRVVRVIEKHAGAGIPREEAVRLGLPARDFIPGEPEEIIVSYADNLINGEVVRSFDQALEAFKNMLGPDHPAIDRFIAMHELIESWIT